MTSSSFPTGFLWGAATSAYQFEGARDAEGKSRSVVDKNINSIFADTRVASDHYHHWKTDIHLMKELGLKSYRFSISWPRVIPDGHKLINPKGIIFYSNLIDELLKNDITPIVTIYHFDLPECLQEEYGGWTSRKILKDFDYYCYILFSNFGNRVKYWLTINEQSNMFALPYLLGTEGEKADEKTKFQMNHIMMLANAKAIQRAHQMIPNCIIGPALGMSPYYPASSKPEDINAAHQATVFRNDFFTQLYFKGTYHQEVLNYLESHNIMPDIKPYDEKLLMENTPDYLGINYYESHTVKTDYSKGNYNSPKMSINETDKRLGEKRPGLYQEVNNDNLQENAWHWSIDPLGFKIILEHVNDLYHIPILITENGIGGEESITSNHKIHDQYRIDFLKAHLRELKKSIDDGVNVIGYEPWSFMDLLSTTNGFKKRYGFVYVNRNDTNLLDLKRYKKDSFYWYHDVIKSNGNISQLFK